MGFANIYESPLPGFKLTPYLRHCRRMRLMARCGYDSRFAARRESFPPRTRQRSRRGPRKASSERSLGGNDGMGAARSVGGRTETFKKFAGGAPGGVAPVVPSGVIDSAAVVARAKAQANTIYRSERFQFR